MTFLNQTSKAWDSNWKPCFLPCSRMLHLFSLTYRLSMAQHFNFLSQIILPFRPFGTAKGKKKKRMWRSFFYTEVLKYKGCGGAVRRLIISSIRWSKVQTCTSARRRLEKWLGFTWKPSVETKAFSSNEGVSHSAKEANFLRKLKPWDLLPCLSFPRAPPCFLSFTVNLWCAFLSPSYWFHAGKLIMSKHTP